VISKIVNGKVVINSFSVNFFFGLGFSLLKPKKRSISFFDSKEIKIKIGIIDFEKS
jgi:hypothetical protein